MEAMALKYNGATRLFMNCISFFLFFVVFFLKQVRHSGHNVMYMLLVVPHIATACSSVLRTAVNEGLGNPESSSACHFTLLVIRAYLRAFAVTLPQKCKWLKRLLVQALLNI
jgi:hypothetical protein